MGCDIHMHVEYKIGNKWYCGDHFYMNADWRDNKTSNEPEYTFVPIYDHRNYALFSVLANVRNSHPPRLYIDTPRGLPEDVCDYVKSDYESWGIDAHSCSYLTLQELIDFHEQQCPVYDLANLWRGYILEDLIGRLKERADELSLIYDYKWTSPHQTTRQEAYETSANIRIVFWFDN